MRFDVAWQAFARHHARIQAPARLEARVLGQSIRPSMTRVRPNRLMPAVVALSATLVLGIVWAPSTEQWPRPVVEGRATIADLRVPLKAQISAAAVPYRIEPPPRRGAVAGAPSRPRFVEALQVVRVRIPRAALGTLGLVLIEPDTASVVDVDVLVGEDGLPLSIRYAQTGVLP